MSSTPRPWTFVLAPLDQAVRNVGGREGASQAPRRLLAALEEADLVPDEAQVQTPPVENTAESLEADLEEVSGAVEAALEEGRLPIVLGGDHGTTYATVRGAAWALGDPGVVYLDAHLDVRDFRPAHTSGSSFRRLVEEEWVQPGRVRPLGVVEPETAEQSSGDKAPFAELQRWAHEQGIEARSMDELRKRPEATVREALAGGPPWCFSIDADVLDERWAPGVSAPGSGRLSLEQARRAAGAARGRYRVLDVVEYAPPLDEGDRTLASCVELLAAALPQED